MRKLKSLFQPIFKIFLSERSSIQFSIGIIVGMAFSIAVILCTVGIMDGFVDTLKGNLRKATGDIIAYSSEGFFNYKDEIEPLLNEMKDEHIHPVDVTALIQTEGFIVSDNLSKGIVLKGIDPESFKKVTGIEAKVTGKEILLGKELAEELNPTLDEQVVIALADGNRELSGMPALNSFIYKGIVDHQIYEKNVRFAYVHNKYLKELLELPLLDNTLLFSLVNPQSKEVEGEQLSAIDDTIIYLLDKLGPIFQVRSYWQEYTPLLEAVRIEKFMIGLILQLIVVISMFNVLAFIIFINEKKVQEVFLLQALGMSRKELLRYMVALTVFLWGFACILSVGFVYFFDYLLQVLPIFQLPGEIYTIGQLKIQLGIGQYIFVFIISAIWLFVINVFGLARFRKKSILSGLRKEFA
jgi:ABC-type lipoprotein release transport system permease subunit